MKIRSGFVSNSSSASFIVEVKPKEGQDLDSILYLLYENIPSFSVQGCKELLEKKLDFKQRFNKPKEDAEEWQIKSYLREVEELQKRIKDLEDYKELSYEELILHEYLYSRFKELNSGEKVQWNERGEIDEKEKSFDIYCFNSFRKEVVLDALRALYWNISLIDDGYISFNGGGPICYNGWDDIRHRKELCELAAFFMFMKYDVRTRIESHEGSF